MGAPVFDVMEHEHPGSDWLMSRSPAWVIAVIPLGAPVSFSRKDMQSISKIAGDGVLLRQPGVFTISSDCTSLSISGSKDSHLKSLAATLKQANINYLVEILPGDWIVAWILNSQDKAQELVSKIKSFDFSGKVQDDQAKQIFCGFDSGLKFVGRAHSVRKSVSVDRTSGVSDVSFNLTAYAFKELETEVFYDPKLAVYAKDNELTWLWRIGFDVNSIFHQTKDGVIDDNVHQIIPGFVDIFLGKGLPPTANITGRSTTQAVVGPLAPTGDDPGEAPYAYIIPAAVGGLLGKPNPSKTPGILAYADILTLLFGVQQYGNINSQNYSVFLPNVSTTAPETSAQHRYTGTPMMGAFLPVFPDFTDKPLWQVLYQWLNPTVNEMYTTFRVNEDGFIQPTVVVRQIPFSTDAFANTATEYNAQITKENNTIDSVQAINTSLASTVGAEVPVGFVVTQKDRRPVTVTPFLSLPRWKINNSMINSLDIGRSDATRTNFISIYGQSGYTQGISIIDQFVNNPPIRNDLDIQRSGLHTYNTVVACDSASQKGNVPGIWMQLVADRMIDSQLTFNGTITCVGIQSPICEGDNLELDDVVYHIEAYSHSCGVGPDGSVSFTTMLRLTNGLRSESAPKPTYGIPPYGLGPDAVLYPGVVQEDNTGLDPGISTVGADKLPKGSDDSTIDRPLDAGTPVDGSGSLV